MANGELKKIQAPIAIGIGLPGMAIAILPILEPLAAIPFLKELLIISQANE